MPADRTNGRLTTSGCTKNPAIFSVWIGVRLDPRDTHGHPFFLSTWNLQSSDLFSRMRIFHFQKYVLYGYAYFSHLVPMVRLRHRPVSFLGVIHSSYSEADVLEYVCLDVTVQACSLWD
jgi:hypothetical protein